MGLACTKQVCKELCFKCAEILNKNETVFNYTASIGNVKFHLCQRCGTDSESLTNFIMSMLEHTQVVDFKDSH